MIRTVLDTSVLVKSIFKPLRSLSTEDYARELETLQLRNHIQAQTNLFKVEISRKRSPLVIG